MEEAKSPKFNDKTAEEFNFKTEQQSDDMNCYGKGGAEMEIRCSDSQNFEELPSTIEASQLELAAIVEPESVYDMRQLSPIEQSQKAGMLEELQ